MITAKHDSILFQPVAYDPHPAMSADRREQLDRAFEAVGFVRSDHLNIPSLTFR